MQAWSSENLGTAYAKKLTFRWTSKFRSAKFLAVGRAGPARPERGGRPRRYFALSPRGMQALRATHAALRSLATGLETILEQS